MPRVLVIDDTVSILQALDFFLQGEGYTVLSATDGASALRLAVEQPVDIVMLDFDMPKMSGIAVCALIRNDPALRHLPVLMMTGRPTPEAITRGKAAGASAVMGKPFDLNLLKATLAQLLTPAAHTPATVQESLAWRGIDR